jgi:hypothetical protein
VGGASGAGGSNGNSSEKKWIVYMEGPGGLVFESRGHALDLLHNSRVSISQNGALEPLDKEDAREIIRAFVTGLAGPWLLDRNTSVLNEYETIFASQSLPRATRDTLLTIQFDFRPSARIRYDAEQQSTFSTTIHDALLNLPNAMLSQLQPKHILIRPWEARVHDSMYAEINAEEQDGHFNLRHQPDEMFENGVRAAFLRTDCKRRIDTRNPDIQQLFILAHMADVTNPITSGDCCGLAFAMIGDIDHMITNQGVVNREWAEQNPTVALLFLSLLSDTEGYAFESDDIRNFYAEAAAPETYSN